MSVAAVASTQPLSLAGDRVLLVPVAHRLGDEERVAAAQGVHPGDQVVGQILGLAVESQRDQLARLGLNQRGQADVQDLPAVAKLRHQRFELVVARAGRGDDDQPRGDRGIIG